MGDILRIYSGGAQIHLYDTTNSVLHLGYVSEDILIESEPQIIPISDGNRVQVEELVSFEAVILQTDETQIDNLMTRKSYLQDVYITGIDSAYKMRNCLIRVKEIRSMKGGETHQVTMSGQRYQQSRTATQRYPETKFCQFIQNFLGAFGACTTDGGSGRPTGWEMTGATSESVDTSYLGGGNGNEYRFTLSDVGDEVRCTAYHLIEQVTMKLTASAYVDNKKAGISYFQFGFRTKNIGGSVLDTKIEEQTLAESADARKTYSVEFTPSGNVGLVEFVIIGSASGTCELGIDNVQLEVGSLTNYVENA